MIYHVENKFVCECGQEDVKENDFVCPHCGTPTLIFTDNEAIEKRRKETENTFKELMKHTNTFFTDDESKIMFSVLVKEHRTIQASFWRLVQILAEHYQNVPHDLRNEAAVNLCKEISKIQNPIPYV